MYDIGNLIKNSYTLIKDGVKNIVQLSSSLAYQAATYLANELGIIKKRDVISELPNSGGFSELPNSDGLIQLYEKPQFTIREINSTYSNKFNATKKTFKIEYRGSNPLEIETFLIDLLKDTIKKKKLHENDLIRLIITHDGLSNTISTKLTKVKELTIDILSTIIGTMEYKEIPLSEAEFTIETIKKPRGAGRTRPGVLTLCEEMIRKKRCTVEINAKEGCLPRCVVVGLTYMSPCIYTEAECKMIRSPGRNKLQEIKAREICEKVNLPFNSTFELEDIKKFEDLCNVKIIVKDFKFDSQYNNKDNKNPKKINILLNTKEEHFQFIITKMNTFVGYNYYCDYCEIGYSNEDRHKCNIKCIFCKMNNCPKDGSYLTCDECNRNFKGKKCFENHNYTKAYKNKTTKTNQQTLSTCDSYFKCLECSVSFKIDKNKQHKCGYSSCSFCKEYTNMDTHQCFIQKKVLPKEPTLNKKIIFWDIEAYTDKKKKHIPYLIVMKDYEGEQHEFNGINEFCNEIFNNDKWKGYTFLAHYGKGYDHQFILEWLLSNTNINNEKTKLPKMTRNGLKLIEMKYLGRRFIDSINFFGMPLRALPKTFGFEKEVKKGFFPHFVNHEGKYGPGYVGPLPPRYYYGYHQMKINDQREFDEWYFDYPEMSVEEKKKFNELYNQVNVDNHYKTRKEFDFNKDSTEYCIDDVEVLRRACLSFQSNLFEKVKIDPFSKVTIASFCQEMYLTHFYDGSMAQFSNEKIISKIGNEWLDYQEEKYSIELDREYRIGNYYVDGYDKEHKIAYNFLGCYWHGCKECYPNRYNEYKNTVYKSKKLQETLGTDSLVEVWECQAMKDVDFTEFRKIYDESVQPIKYRDALFGGRCEPIYLYKQIADEAYYDDVVSLYPSVQKIKYFPKGHPKKLREPKSFDNNWFGLIKAKILPPRKLFIPVVPVKVHYKVNMPHAYNGKTIKKETKKLMFSLCKTCVELNQKTTCNHNDEERSFTGSWTTEEIKESLAIGYEIKNIYEVWDFEKTDSLWKDYIDFWLKIKYEASGVPPGITIDEYIKKVKISDGIDLDPDNIKFNPGLRAIAKLCLNSLWGKFAQRDNFTTTQFITKPNDFFSILYNDENDVSGLDFYKNDEICCISYKSTEDAIECGIRTNPVVAAFVTSWARITLLKRLQKSGMDTLYMDTDSVVTMKNLPTGNCLGEWERENKIVDKFVASGPKSYAYRTKKKDGFEDTCKFKGFILNAENKKYLNNESLLKMVLGENKNKRITLINERKITRCKDGSLVNKYEEKEFTFDYDKRVMKKLDNGDIITYPYGY